MIGILEAWLFFVKKKLSVEKLFQSESNLRMMIYDNEKMIMFEIKTQKGYSRF